MITRLYCSGLVGLVTACLGCSSTPPTPPPAHDAGPPSCTVSATTTYDAATKVVTGSGSLSCSPMADLSLKVCLYAKLPTEPSWGTPLQCRTSAASGRTALSTEAAVNIGIGGTKEYRTIADARTKSVDQPSQISAVISAP